MIFDKRIFSIQAIHIFSIPKYWDYVPNKIKGKSFYKLSKLVHSNLISSRDSYNTEDNEEGKLRQGEK